MDNILVLGAGALQVPLIEKIQSRGFNPVVVSLHDDEPGMLLVKDRVVADFCDKDVTLEIAKKFSVKGVVTDQTDLPVRTIAYVCDVLGLPSIGYDTACLFTDKYLMREKCKELGINTIRYALVNTLEEALSFYKSLSRPIIIKPINNQGSKGVYKVDTLEELKSKFADAIRYSRGEAILIEEFITGEELVIEAFACDGIVENLVCGDTHYFNIPDAFSACERVFPSRNRSSILKKTLDLNKKIVKGFGLNRGLTHGEYIIDGDEVYLIEIAARGGGVYISSDIIPLMTGFNSTDFIIDIATQRVVNTPNYSYFNRVACYIAFFLPEGVINSISGVDKVKSLSFVHHNNLDSLYLGKTIGASIDKTSRYFFILEANDFDQLDLRVNEIRHNLNITVSNNTETKSIIWK